SGAIGGVALITESISALPATPLPSLTRACALAKTGSGGLAETCEILVDAAEHNNTPTETIHLNISLLSYSLMPLRSLPLHRGSVRPKPAVVLQTRLCSPSERRQPRAGNQAPDRETRGSSALRRVTRPQWPIPTVCR